MPFTPAARTAALVFVTLAGATPLRAAPASGFSVADAARNQALITGQPPRMSALPPASAGKPAEGTLAPRDRELVVLRIAWLCQSPFVWSKHVRSAKAAGVLTGEDVERLIAGSTARGWSDHDRTILRAAEELQEHSMVTDETWSALSKELDQNQQIDLPLLIGHVHAGSYLQNYLRLPLDKGSRGLLER